MNELITIRTFIYPHEMDMVRIYLESRGVECFVKDEHTVQTYHMFSPAVGGVKLQVRQEDFQRAEQLLIEGGYLRKENSDEKQPYQKLERFASRVPIIKKWRPEYRISFVVGITVLLLMTSVYFVFFSGEKTITTSELTSGKWCVLQIKYRDKNYKPNTKAETVNEVDTDSPHKIRINILTSCKEYVEFNDDQTLRLPGIGTRAIQAEWYWQDDKLHIHNSDTLRLVYNGSYKIKRRNDVITLTSNSTVIRLKEDDYIRQMMPVN